RATSQAGAQTRLQHRIRAVLAAFFAVLVTSGKGQVAGRQGDNSAGQVGAQHLGGVGVGVVARQGQVVLHRLVDGQATNTGFTVSQQRVPRGATCDHLAFSTAVSDAVLDERRADGIGNVRGEQVTGAGLDALVLVVDVANIPVEVAISELER